MKRLRRALRIAVLAAAVATTAARAASGDVVFDALRIEWSAARGGSVPETKAAKAACAALMRELRTLPEAGNRELFESHACQVDKAMVAGSAGNASWMLRLHDTGAAMELTLVYAPEGVEPMLLARTALSKSVEVVKAIAADDEAARALAAYVAMSLPASGRTVLDERGIPSWKPRRGSWVAFTLTFEPRRSLFMPTVVAAADEDADWRRVGAAEGASSLFVQRVGLTARDDEAAVAELSEALADAEVEFETRERRRLVGHGYFGAKLGVPIVRKENELLKEMRLVSFAFERLEGLLAGIRLLYDWTPRVDNHDASGRTRFDSRRALVSYALSWSAPELLTPLIDRFGVAPKMGQWSIAVDMPVQRSDGTYVQGSAHVERAPSVGIEAYAERSLSSFVLRAAAAGDIAVSIGAIEGEVRGRRYSGELLGPLFDEARTGLSLSWNAFAFRETYLVTSDDGYKIGFDVTWLGFGLLVSD